MISMLTIVTPAIHEKGITMTEQNLPEEGLEVVQDDDVLLDETPGAASSLELDPVHGEPDSYPGAAENNPDRWQEDPLIQDESVADAEFGEAAASDDEETFGGSPLSEFEPDDLER
ncbi:hypothetical protein GCM10018951_39610 [Pseudarthrobacter polychromogenes]